MAIIGISKILVPGSNPGVPAFAGRSPLRRAEARKFMHTKIGFLTGTSMGYFTGNFLAGPQASQPGIISSIILNFGGWQFHLHHWLIAFGILIFFYSFLNRRYLIPSFFLAFSSGLLSGLIFQGIFCYDDWYKILIR